MRNSFKHSFMLPKTGVGLFLVWTLIGAPQSARAAVTAASLSTYSIPFETVGAPTTTTVQFTLDAISDVEVDIFRLENTSDVPGPENQVAAIQQTGLGVGAHTILWDALWLLGGDLGRQNGNYQVIVNATSAGTTSSFVIGTLLTITSLDIHSVSVVPSLDANQNPALPFLISYALAKDSLVTIQVLDSSGNLVRTLLFEAPQYGESIRTNTLTWNGLNDQGRPVALGIYTVTIDAKVANSTDRAVTRTRSAAVQSLASLSSNPKEIFEANAYVYPNPVRNGQATFKFLAVRSNATITLKIYTIAGDLVREESFPNLTTGNTVTFNWNAENQSGKKVGRGLYYYVVREEDSEGTLQTIKKLAVIP